MNVGSTLRYAKRAAAVAVPGTVAATARARKKR